MPPAPSHLTLVVLSSFLPCAFFPCCFSPCFFLIPLSCLPVWTCSSTGDERTPVSKWEVGAGLDPCAWVPRELLPLRFSCTFTSGPEAPVCSQGCQLAAKQQLTQEGEAGLGIAMNTSTSQITVPELDTCQRPVNMHPGRQQ